MTAPLEVIEISLAPGERRTLSVNYPLLSWRIYSTSPSWLSGTVAIMPGTSLGADGSIQMIPNMRLRLPAIGQCLTLKNSSSVIVKLVLQVS